MLPTETEFVTYIVIVYPKINTWPNEQFIMHAFEKTNITLLAEIEFLPHTLCI